jgi:hypothetical protein
MVNAPIAVANMVVELLFTALRPAAVDEALQLYVAPGLFVTLRLTLVPKQTGFGIAVILDGAAGDPGSDKLTIPLYTAEAQPLPSVILNPE